MKLTTCPDHAEKVIIAAEVPSKNIRSIKHTETSVHRVITVWKDRKRLKHVGKVSLHAVKGMTILMLANNVS